ncbi:MAG: glycosyltransferase family 4 protein [Deltaproteobacteria bacterium]|nr:glycosyltransferase family 4 protein [Deltaproteobacteria bacterium]
MGMKIVHLSTESTWRGGEQQLLYLIAGLKKRGHTAHLICQSSGGLHDRAVQQGIDIFPLRMRGEVDVVAAVKIARLMRREKYEIIHSHSAHALSLVMAAFCLMRQRPISVLTRRVEFSIFRHNFLGMNRYKYMKGTDQIIAISERVKGVLVEDGFPSEKIAVVYSGVDMHRFRGMSGDYVLREFSVPSGAPVLGNVGFLEENKGQKWLIQAMATVVKRYPEIRLFILGTGRLESQLRALVKELDLERTVIFTGYRNDAGSFFNVFDLVVAPSVEEGLNSSILDALALELPVVATTAGGIPEIITHEKNGYLVPREDAESLATGIIHMLDHQDQAKAMGKQGRLKVEEKFSDTAMVEGNLAVYRRLIAEKRGGGRG